MIELKRLGEDLSPIKEYLMQYGGGFCDLTLGVRYMWRDKFEIEYCEYNQTLIMKESTPEYQEAFYYPMGKDIEGALKEIEEYCKARNKPLQFCCIDNQTAVQLSKRYKSVQITNDRDWSDYVYDAEKFKTYKGKKYNGQRNHVNKFKRLYPEYVFKEIEPSDFERISEFLEEYNDGKKRAKKESQIDNEKGWLEEYENQQVKDLIKNMQDLNQDGGLIEVHGKVIAISVGERIGETLIVHIEKALSKYDGIFPLMAQEFAKRYGDGIKYINREEDCGDNGLRISKLQYGPIDVKEKNFVKVRTLFDKITPPVLIKTERLEITDIYQSDKSMYYVMYIDEELNKWWGYDYKEDLKEQKPTPEYFYRFMQGLKEKKEEYSLAVKKDGEMIGEIVLHNFDYFGGVEIGYRFIKAEQGKGYATESAKAVIEYIYSVLGAEKIKTRCFKENIASKNLATRLGFEKIKEDESHIYFEKIKIE